MRRLVHRRLLSLALAVAVLGGTSATAAAANGAGIYAVDLYRPGDFVRQTNLVQCVGSSIQMMINMLAATNDRTAETQLRLQAVARTYSDLLSPRPGRKGASVWGWAAALNELHLGPYEVAGFATIDDALGAAAQAISHTGRPVGLLVWRGRHAWVMSGFRAKAHPRIAQAFQVTEVAVLDPLYPSTSPTWGSSPAPGSRLTVAQLGRHFVARRWKGGTALTRSLGGPFVVVLPVDPAPGLAGRMRAT